MLVRIVLYTPIIKSMYAPDKPGRIIAEIPTNPDKKINQSGILFEKKES